MQTPHSFWFRLPLLPLAILAAIFCSLTGAATSSAQALFAASPDITIPLGPVVATDETVVLDNQLGIVVAEDLGPIPDASDVVALSVGLGGDRLIAFDTTTALAGGVVARPGDVVRYDGLGYAIEFDASAAGLPSGVRTDAVSISPRGLVLSFDTTADLGGVVVADEDLVEWNGSGFTKVFDGSFEGLDVSLDTDAVQALGGGAYLLSFDVTGSIAGLSFDDEDVLRFEGGSFSLVFDGSSADSDWAAADLDAVMVPEPAFAGPLLLGAIALGAGRHGGRR